MRVSSVAVLKVRTALLVLTAALGLPTLAAAAAPLEIGARVRLAGIGRPDERSSGTGTAGLATGRLLATDAETLTVLLASGSELTFRWDELRLVEVSGGRRSRGAGALRGGARGFLAGAALGAAVLLVYSASDDPDAGDRLLAGAVAIDATLLGTTAGAIVGTVAPGERWSKLEARPRFALAPTYGPRGRGAGLALSVRF